MARTTAKQVLDRVDALLPNGYARAEKLRWLAQAEGFVRRELCRETGELPGADRGDGADGGAAL